MNHWFALIKVLIETGLQTGGIVVYEEGGRLTIDGKEINPIPEYSFFLEEPATKQPGASDAE